MKSLKSALYVQFFIVLLPVVGVFVFQSYSGLARSREVNAAYDTYRIAEHKQDGYKTFMNGVSDAIDRGRLSTSALAALTAANDAKQAIDSAPWRALDAKLIQLATKLAADPSLIQLTASRTDILEIGKQLTESVNAEQTRLDTILDASYTSTKRESMAVAIVMVITLAVIVIMIRRLVLGITTPLSAAVRLANDIAAGNLDRKIDVTERNEIGELQTALSSMSKKLFDLVVKTKETADAVATSSTLMCQEFTTVTERIGQQSMQITGVSASFEQLSVSISEISHRTNEVSGQSTKAHGIAINGHKEMAKSMRTNQQIRDSVNDSNTMIAKLRASIDHIQEIAGIIKGIADQTNLLALNAAIEAARAGEQGRGFAVVADEVRKLAQHTASSTLDITSTLSEVRENADAAVASMRGVTQNSCAGVDSLNETSKHLDDIVSTANHVSELVLHIANATREQRDAIDNTAKSMAHINVLAENNSASISHANATASSVANRSLELQKLVAHFRV